MEYFVYRDGKQIGPLILSEVTARLASGDFALFDHVWHEGLSQSKTLSELFGSQTESVPPIQEESLQDQPTESVPEPARPRGDRVAIPPEVMNAIRIFAEREYPDDFAMQKYTIEEQRESFSAIQHLSLPDIPKSVFAKIYERAATEYPDDYSMQKYTIEEQVEAYRELHSR